MQTFLVIVIIALSLAYTVFRVEKVLNTKNTHCQGCEGCSMKEGCEKKYENNRTNTRKDEKGAAKR
jgi:hypothetical protein